MSSFDPRHPWRWSDLQPLTSMLLIFTVLPIAPNFASAATTITALTSTSTDASTATSGNSSVATSTESSCDYDGSVGTYLSCEKKRISTGTLIGAGVGITLGIFILAFGCIWASKRRRSSRVRAGRQNISGKALEVEEEYEYGRGIELNAPRKNTYVTGEGRERRIKRRSNEGSADLAKAREDRNDDVSSSGMDTRAARVEDASDSDSVMANAVPRSQAKTGSADTVQVQSSQRANNGYRLQSRSGDSGMIDANGSPAQPNVATPRQLYPANPSVRPPEPKSSNSRSRSTSETSVSSSSTVRPPPSYTSAVAPAPPLPPPSTNGDARQSSYQQNSGLYGGSASQRSRPFSTISAASNKPPSGAGEGRGGIPPVPSLKHGVTLPSQIQGARPPTRLMRTESELPHSSSLTIPNRLTRAESESAALPPSSIPRPERQGSTLPLNVPSRKSVAQSNYVPSYYQTTSSDEETLDPLHPLPKTQYQSSDMPLPRPNLQSTYDPPSLPRSNAEAQTRKPSRSRAPPPSSRYIPRRPSDYARLDSASSSSASERASSGSERMAVQPIPPFRKGSANASSGIGASGRSSAVGKSDARSQIARNYTQGSVI